MVVAIIINDHDGESIQSFIKSLSTLHWEVTTRQVSYPTIGDSVADSCTILTAIHLSCAPQVKPVMLAVPPTVKPLPLSHFIYEPFNRPEHSLCYGYLDAEFNNDDTPLANIMTVSKPTAAEKSSWPDININYHLHRKGATLSSSSGSSVLSKDSLCPPYNHCSNNNIFQQFFGIEFNHIGHTYVRTIFPHKFTRCFQLTEKIQYSISHDSNNHNLDAAMPGRTSSWLFLQLYHTLVHIRDINSETVSHYHAAPPASIQTLVNGTICTKLPSREQWIQAYRNDKEMCALTTLVLKPDLINNKSLAEINHNYRGAIRNSYICIEDDMLIFKEPIGGSSSYTRLQIVPREFYNVIFVAFHTNPIGGHLNPYRTLHRIRLRFYFPGMYTYIVKMCSTCPGCALSNPTCSKSSELIYGFPVEAPFKVMHFDGFSAGTQKGFEGNECFLIGCCGMTAFACVEPVSHATATTFASAIMKILLRFGICFTAVLDKDSKFFGVCREALALLQVNCHILSSTNANPMLVERINRYLNKGLKIMCNERESIRVAQESILLLLYAWNSCPIAGTDISRSLVAVGREFQFPIDFSSDKHLELTSTTNAIQSYSNQLALRLEACHKVAHLLVTEMRSYHREMINAKRPDPRVYAPGDIVFARRTVKSDAKRGIVDKLKFAYTGPWRIIKHLSGASYEIVHADKATRKDKKHASDLCPYPPELIPFQPVDGCDNQFGQLYKPISASAFKEAGLKGIEPIKPYVLPANMAVTGQCHAFHWPSLSELNEELDFPEWQNDFDCISHTHNNIAETRLVLSTGPPPEAPKFAADTILSIEILMASIIKSEDRLFFVSINIGHDCIREWRLAHLSLDQSMALYPSCTQDGRFLFEIYLSHPSDWRYNAINQRFWLQYHHIEDIKAPSPGADTHLIRPSPSSSQYAEQHKLQPLRKWINITHHDTFIHGPFEFAIINGRKSRDRINAPDWQILRLHHDMFRNPVPSADVPTYSIHVDRGAHTQFHSKHHCQTLAYEATRSYPTFN